MKILLSIVVLGLISTQIQADVWVDGYTRDDGTYVQGHHRTRPNHSIYDNYSTKGNTNPWTGEKGTKSYDYGYSKPRRSKRLSDVLR